MFLLFLLLTGGRPRVSKKAKKIKRNKMEQSRFAGLCYFCSRIKKSAHNDTTFKKIAYLCPVS